MYALIELLVYFCIGYEPEYFEKAPEEHRLQFHSKPTDMDVSSVKTKHNSISLKIKTVQDPAASTDADDVDADLEALFGDYQDTTTSTQFQGHRWTQHPDFISN